MRISKGHGGKVVMAAVLCAVAVTGLTATAASATAAKHHRAGNGDPTIYDSTVEPDPGNLPSQSYEATATAEFGNQITFGGSARVLDTVVVQMSSWGCQSGNWSTYATSPCVTTPGATFTEPITLDIYNVGPASAYGPSTPGSLVTSVTQTFTIPYRPSADTNYTTDCAATATADDVPVSDFAGTWYDAALNRCFNGYLTPITFTLGHVVVPNSIIYGIAYNTSDFGYQPYGDDTACHSSPGGCGYDSLNVALSQEPTSPSVGTDDYPGTAYVNIDNAGYESNYCDDGAAGLNVFRIDEPAHYPTTTGTDSNCYSVNGDSAAPFYVPAVQFNAVANKAALITSPITADAVAGQPFGFTVTTTGVPTPAITARGKIPHGLSFFSEGNGSAIIVGTPFTTDHDGTYRLTIRASNLPSGGRSRQSFSIVLTGGRS